MQRELRVAKGKTAARRSTQRGGPSGFLAWTLWLVVIVLLAVIARYAYIAAQPDKACYTLLGRTPSCDAAAPRDYSKSDRAKLDALVDQALPAKR